MSGEDKIRLKIKELETEYARTQKNKATEGHLGLLKAKLSKLRRELTELSSTRKSGGGAGEVPLWSLFIMYWNMTYNLARVWSE